MTKIELGDVIDARRLTTIDGDALPLPDPNSAVHLQFRRFAGCPICGLHLRSYTQRHEEITAAGIREVAVFHSDAEALRRYRSDLPFDVVADPDQSLYRDFGVGSSPRAVLGPTTMISAVRGMIGGSSLRGAASMGEKHLGQPADFLLAPDGTILARTYGVHADDGWSVDELIDLHGQALTG